MLSRRAKVKIVDSNEMSLFELSAMLGMCRRGQIEAKHEIIKQVKLVVEDLEKTYLEDRVSKIKRNFLRDCKRPKRKQVDCRRHLRSNQSRESEVRKQKCCRNRKIVRLVSACKIIAENASKASSPPKTAPVIVERAELSQDDPRGKALWGLSPRVWLRLTPRERSEWDQLNRSARASGKERERLPDFLRLRGARGARGDSTTTPKPKPTTKLGISSPSSPGANYSKFIDRECSWIRAFLAAINPYIAEDGVYG